MRKKMHNIRNVDYFMYNFHDSADLFCQIWYSNPFASMIFGPREKSCYSKIMLWKSATKNFYSVIISHYTRENFYSMIISHYTKEKCNYKKFQCYISLLMYIHTDKIFVQCIRLQIKLTNY